MMFTLIVPPLFGADRQIQSPSERPVSLQEVMQATVGNNLSVRLSESGTLRFEHFERGRVDE